MFYLIGTLLLVLLAFLLRVSLWGKAVEVDMPHIEVGCSCMVRPLPTVKPSLHYRRGQVVSRSSVGWLVSIEGRFYSMREEELMKV